MNFVSVTQIQSSFFYTKLSNLLLNDKYQLQSDLEITEMCYFSFSFFHEWIILGE